MDWQMPVMDGITATRAIRNREWREGGHLPIVAMTANTLSRDRARCRAAGMDDFVPKPVKPDVLHAALARFATPKVGA